jgi:hypothetical protein
MLKHLCLPALALMVLAGAAEAIVNCAPGSKWTENSNHSRSLVNQKLK